MVARRRTQRAAVFRAIADPTRREILSLLRRGPHTVGAIAANFRTSRPAISKHLRLLRSVVLVATRQDGTARVCQLNARPLWHWHWRQTFQRARHVSDRRASAPP